MSANELIFPPDVKWFSCHCHTCEHQQLFEFIRDDDGSVVGVRFHDPNPETLPPGSREIMAVDRIVKRANRFDPWKEAEAATG